MMQFHTVQAPQVNKALKLQRLKAEQVLIQGIILMMLPLRQLLFHRVNGLLW